MIRYRALCSLLALGFVLLAAGACATPDPTSAVVENKYPDTVVYKVWWVETLFPDPVAPGETSTEFRTVPGHGVAVVLLAPGWDPASGAAPTSFVIVKSKEIISVSRGDTLHITVSDELFGGSCAARQQIPQEDADFVTERIFPAEFANARYDARNCTLTPNPVDAGTD